MGTAATATKLGGVSCIGPEMYAATYTLAFDTTTAAGLMTVDLTSDFAYCHLAVVAANDTAANNGYIFRCLHPGATTELTATNLSVEVRDEALATVDSTNLSAIGALQLFVIGKKA